MVALPNVNTKSFGSKFLLNKSLSNDLDEVLHLQGVSWLKRRAVSLFSLTLCVKHTTDEAGIKYFDMDQIVSGIPSTCDKGILDTHEQDHLIFGLVTSKYTRVPVEEIMDAYLKKDWAQDCIEGGVVLCDSWSTPDKNSWTWRKVQVWSA